MRIGDVGSAVGKGILAGAAGTAAITAFTLVEARVKGKEESTAPAEAAGKVLGVQPRGEEEKKRFSNLAHWGYGTGWGAVRGLLGLTGLKDPAATGVFFGAVWGTALGMLPGLKVAPPPTEWGKEELGLDAARHLVYATTTSAAFNFLDRRSSRGQIAA